MRFAALFTTILVLSLAVAALDATAAASASATVLASDSPSPSLYAVQPAGNGEFCGGIAGVPCGSGLECVLDGTYADAGGLCQPAETSGSSSGPAATFDVKLNTGWNLISLPVVQSLCPYGAQCLVAPSVPVVSTTCTAAQLDTFTFDPVVGKYTHASLDLNAVRAQQVALQNYPPSQTQTPQVSFPSGTPLRGYWVFANESCAVSVAGSPFTPAQVGAVLSDGWNLVGAPLSTSTWNDVRGECQATRGPYAYDTAAKRYVVTDLLEAGKGYFVKVQGECRMAREKSMSEKQSCQDDSECVLQPSKWCECSTQVALNAKYFTPLAGPNVFACIQCPAANQTRAACQSGLCRAVRVQGGVTSACPVSTGDDLILNAPDGAVGENLTLTLTLGGMVVRSSNGIEVWKAGTTNETLGRYVLVTTVGNIELPQIGCTTLPVVYAPQQAGDYKAIFHYKLSQTSGERSIETTFQVS